MKLVLTLKKLLNGSTYLKIKHINLKYKTKMIKNQFNNINKLLNNPEILVITADKNLGYTIVNVN